MDDFIMKCLNNFMKKQNLIYFLKFLKNLVVLIKKSRKLIS